MTDTYGDTPLVEALRNALSKDWLEPNYEIGHELLSRLAELDLGAGYTIPGDPLASQTPIPGNQELLEGRLGEIFKAAHWLLETRHWHMEELSAQAKAHTSRELVAGADSAIHESNYLSAQQDLQLQLLKYHVSEESVDAIRDIIADLQERWSQHSTKPGHAAKVAPKRETGISDFTKKIFATQTAAYDDIMQRGPVPPPRRAGEPQDTHAEDSALPRAGSGLVGR